MKKSVLITGASGNLGQAVLKRFSKEDFLIAALHSPRHASEVENSDNLRTFGIDLMDEVRAEEVVRDVFSVFGNLEMAILTVGGFAMGNFDETALKELDRMYRLNFLSAYTVARQVFRGMLEQKGGGQLVFVGSRPALHPEEAKDMLAYALAKSLVFRLAEVINEEGKPGGISASVVIPGTMDTPQNRSAMPGEDFSKWVPPDEVADKIYRLSTPAGRRLRGSIIKVYGDS